MELSFKKFNEYRQQQNLYRIEWDDNLMKGCKDQLMYIIKQGKLSHDNFKSRLGIYFTANENAAMVSSRKDLTAEQIADKFMQKWVNSPTHQENLVAQDVKKGVICIAWTKEPTFNNVYWALQHNVSYFKK